jgi:histidinol-phosphatase (PHP family)
VIKINFIIDYHVHSTFSHDGKASIEDICSFAVKKRVDEVCFTEHISATPASPCCHALNMEEYSKEIFRCTNLFEGKLVIKKGIELGEPHLYSNELIKYTSDKTLDFVLGSVHFIADTDLVFFAEDKSTEESYLAYFNEVYNSVSAGDIDALGHFDLLKRYAFDLHGKYRHADFKDLIHEILRKAVSRNIGIEINTSGFRSSSLEIFPSQDILRDYKELGGKIITVGSDSHAAETVGNNIPPVYFMLKQLGFKHVYTFDKRNPDGIKI